MGTRVRIGVLGQATGFTRIRLDLTANEDAIRADILAQAAEKLSVPLPADMSTVRLFLSDGDQLEEMAMIEKDDTIWVAFDGASWREPGTSDEQSSPELHEEAPQPPSESTTRLQQPTVFKPQGSIGSFFGSGTKRSYERVDGVGKFEKSGPPQHLSEEELRAVPRSTAGACGKCGPH